MDANNVFVIINPLQNGNLLIDWIQSIIENSIISIIGGIFAAVISVYITVEFTVLKGDSIKFNKIMVKVIIEIKEIKRKMEKSFFSHQIKNMKHKAQQRKEGHIIWVGFDKEDYAESMISRYQYLPVYWLSIFFMQAYELYGDDKQISEKIQLIKNLRHSSLEFNRQLQYIESHLEFELKKIESNFSHANQINNFNEKSKIFDLIVDDHIKQIWGLYNETRLSIEKLINEINPGDDEKLLIKVNFWPSILISLVKSS